MNSVYKRYFIITLIALLCCVGASVSTVRGIVSEIDRVNAYVAEKDSTKGFEFKNLVCYASGNAEQEYDYFPDFEYAGQRCRDNSGNSIWTVALVLVTAMFYLHERGSATADFCALLPIKRRNMFIFKLLGLIIIALGLSLVNIWSIYQFNMRVDACNITCKALGMERIYAVDYGLSTFMLQRLAGKAAMLAVFLFLGECTGRAYLPPCIAVLAVYALAGSMSGIYNFLDYYFGIRMGALYLSGRVGIRYYNAETCLMAVIALVFILWGLFLSGRGDMSRKGRVFRFKWVENIALLCIVVCAALCSIEVMYLCELNYSVNAVGAVIVMLLSGAAAYFISRRVILWLGR